MLSPLLLPLLLLQEDDLTPAPKPPTTPKPYVKKIIRRDGGPEEKADVPYKLLVNAAKALDAARSLTAEVEITRPPMGAARVRWTGTAQLKKPNLARIELTGRYSQNVVSDGKMVWFLSNEVKQYRRAAADAHGRNIAPTDLPLHFFFDSHLLSESAARPDTLHAAAPEKVNGVEYKVVEVGAPTTPVKGGLQPLHYKLFFGADGLVHRAVALSGNQELSSATLRNVKLNASTPDQAFTFQPPANTIEAR